MNDVTLNVSEIIAEYVRRVEVAMDSVILIELKNGLRNLKSPEQWRTALLNHFPLFQKKIEKIALDALRNLPSLIRKGVYLNYRIGDSETSYEKAYEMLKESRSIQMPLPVIQTTNLLISEMNDAVRVMAHNKLVQFKRAVGQIYGKAIITTEPAKTIYNTVMAKTTSIVDGKRVVSPLQGNLQTRTSIELGVRRSMQEVTVQAMEESGPVFILCSSHGNSAPDHKDHQGKVYYDVNWMSHTPIENHDRVRNIINKKNMKSYQWVKSEPVKMWTRWNCTHKQMQIPIDEVERMTYDELLAKYNLKTNGSYDKKKYKAQQKQRYLERKRRKVDEKMVLLKNAGLGSSEMMKKLEIQDKKWSKKITGHLSSHSLYLTRQREREKAKTLMFDFGVKLQFKE